MNLFISSQLFALQRTSHECHLPHVNAIFSSPFYVFSIHAPLFRCASRYVPFTHPVSTRSLPLFIMMMLFTQVRVTLSPAAFAYSHTDSQRFFALYMILTLRFHLFNCQAQTKEWSKKKS